MFIPGIELSRRFYVEVIGPFLAAQFPYLRYAAALAGGGSELLGFDTPLSTDHDWGPRLTVFLSQQDFGLAPEIAAKITGALPERFLGHVTRFEDRRRPGETQPGAYGSSNHGVGFYTLEAFTAAFLPQPPNGPEDIIGWLALPQQLLLAFASSPIFHDGVGDLTALQQKLSAYPDDIRKYLLACYWNRIAEEQSFVGRCGAVGDEAGSAIIAARIVRDMMRMGFLYAGKYAPYSKWLGTGFMKLAFAPAFETSFSRVLQARDWQDREQALCDCYRALGKLHLGTGLPRPTLEITDFHDRPYRVCNADDFTHALRYSIANLKIAFLPLEGNIDIISDNTVMLNSPTSSRAVIEAIFRNSLHPTE